MGGHVHPSNEGATACRQDAGGEHPGGRRLPGAVRPQEPENLACVNVKVEPVDCGRVGAGVDLGQLLGMDNYSPIGPGLWPNGAQGSGCGAL